MKLPKELTTITPVSRFLTLVLLLSLPFVGFLLGLKYQEQFIDYLESHVSVDQYVLKTQPTTTPVASTENWKTYRNSKYGFVIKHPTNLTPKERYNHIYLELWGPTQRTQQGFHDGIALSFYVGSLEGNTLQEFVDAKIKETENSISAQIAEYPSKVIVGGVDGYSYRSIGAGPFTSIYLSPKPNTYFLILDGTVDPTNQGFKKTVDQILSTFKFITP